MRHFLLALACSAVYFVCAGANAECQRPNSEVSIPDGASATKEDMFNAQRQLAAFDGKLGDYERCIRGEASQSIVGKSEDVRNAIVADYVKHHNEAAIELAGLAGCFNAQLASFKKTGGGKAAQPADCASFMEAAKNTPPSEPEPLALSNIVKEADGHTFDLIDGVWSYALIRDDTPRGCGTDGKQSCVERIVYVSNNSSQALECKGYIAYESAGIEGKLRVDAQGIVAEKSARMLVRSLAVAGAAAQTFDAECTPRAALPKLDTPDTCKYEVVTPVNISDFYPAESRKLGEEGPVIVEFTVPGKAAHPTDVKVAASSLLPRLDKAAIDAVTAMVLSSGCSKKRYRLKLSFQLE